MLKYDLKILYILEETGIAASNGSSSISCSLISSRTPFLLTEVQMVSTLATSSEYTAACRAVVPLLAFLDNFGWEVDFIRY